MSQTIRSLINNKSSLHLGLSRDSKTPVHKEMGIARILKYRTKARNGSSF